MRGGPPVETVRWNLRAGLSAQPRMRRALVPVFSARSRGRGRRVLQDRSARRRFGKTGLPLPMCKPARDKSRTLCIACRVHPEPEERRRRQRAEDACMLTRELKTDAKHLRCTPPRRGRGAFAGRTPHGAGRADTSRSGVPVGAAAAPRCTRSQQPGGGEAERRGGPD